MAVVDKDDLIDTLDLTSIEGFSKLIEALCGQELSSVASESGLWSLRWTAALAQGAQGAFRVEHLNELLILSGQNLVSPGFFHFFFEPTNEAVGLSGLRQGVKKFRLWALLRYGNFRHPFQTWRTLSKEAIADSLARVDRLPSTISETGHEPRRTIRFTRIEKAWTFATGELSAPAALKELLLSLGLCRALGVRVDTSLVEKAAKESGLLPQSQSLAPANISTGNLSRALVVWTPKAARRAEGFLAALVTQMASYRRMAMQNTVDYLLADRIDLYVATSMREPWEFEQTASFLEDLFEGEQFPFLRGLNYFDPTQSLCSRIDKGLVEGLMLNRVSVTLYMAQESDTLGKDSELASTLAQGKPVIAFVPKIPLPTEHPDEASTADFDRWAVGFRERPVSFFRRRLLLLEAQGILASEDFHKGCARIGIGDPSALLEEFHKAYEAFGALLSLFPHEHNIFKETHASWFWDFVRAFTLAEAVNFEKRATTLKVFHPLALQLDMRNGVANGVLVVRRPEECAELLEALFKGKLRFDIVYVRDGERVVGTALQEKISGSRYRAVTADKVLTASFWNYFRGFLDN